MRKKEPQPLTIEKLKELMNRPDMSDAEAQEIIFSIEALVGIIMDYQEDQEEKLRKEANKSE